MRTIIIVHVRPLSWGSIRLPASLDSTSIEIINLLAFINVEGDMNGTGFLSLLKVVLVKPEAGNWDRGVRRTNSGNFGKLGGLVG